MCLELETTVKRYLKVLNYMTRGRFSSSSIVACSESQDGEDSPSLDSLPNGVIIDILQRLPAQFLQDSARFVCKKWAEILQLPFFINSHLLHSNKDNHGFLIQDGRSPYKAQFVNIRGWDRKFKINYLNLKFPGKISGSSDGVLLINRSSSSLDLYVANPVTKQVQKLPYLASTCRLSSHCHNIAKIPSTGELKVVSLARDSNGIYSWYVLSLDKAIDTMRWRKMSKTAATAECDPASYLSCVQSLSADGVIYWTNSSWISNRSVLAMDLNDETAHHLRAPVRGDGEYWTLVQMGKRIGCMNCGKNLEMKVWVLKDLQRNEWDMVKSVSFPTESQLRRKFCMPLIWVDPQIVVLSVYFQVRNAVVAYHLKRGDCKVVKIDDVARHPIFLHTNSLLRF